MNADNFPELRSARWMAGDDEAALMHRAALRAGGSVYRPAAPVIGILDTAGGVNPCNLPARDVIADIAIGIRSMGATAVVVPTMTLGEDLMKPSAMLYRNLMAMEIEENLRSYPLDGVVATCGCDKTVAAALMGLVSADLPALLMCSGARPAAEFRGRPLRAGTDLWRYLDDHRSGRMSDADWAEFEACYGCGQGTCNTMGTASTMAMMAEALGLMLPGTALIPAADPARKQLGRQIGEGIVQLVRDDVRPSLVADEAALDRAVTVLCSAGGSTNAILHLCAVAGRLGLPLPLERFDEIAACTPVLADVEPSGSELITSLHEAGGVPALLAAVAGERQVSTVGLRAADDPVVPGPAFVVVRGSLAPDGAVLKACAASESLMQHRGPALVFEGYDDMRERLDDPELEVTPETVLILAGCGPVGVPGMPEWGMIPIPVRLAEQGVTDMVRITDSRMSGTSFGTCFLHVAPEAAIGGPLGLVRTGDMIVIDVPNRRIDLDVPDDELDRRRAQWQPPVSKHRRGWPALYQRSVLQAPEGADLDFLRCNDSRDRGRIEPVVGRS